MDHNHIEAVDRQAREHFTYHINDLNKWRSYADEALAGTPWAGDCSDLASTVLDLLGRLTVPLSSRWRLLVSATQETKPDHMVACVQDNEGAFWIVGDTFGPCYRAADMRHRALFFNSLDENDPQPIWRTGVPWK